MKIAKTEIENKCQNLFKLNEWLGRAAYRMGNVQEQRTVQNTKEVQLKITPNIRSERLAGWLNA